MLSVNLVLAVQSFSDPELQGRAIAASNLAALVLRDIGRDDLATTGSTAATLAYIGRLLKLGGESETSFVSIGEEDLLNGATVKVPIDSLAGAYLLARWGLPWQFIEAAAYYKEPIASTELGFGITTAVHIACGLVDGDTVDASWLEFLDAKDLLVKWKTDAENLMGLRS
jgi:hypothetical protein